MDCDGAFITPTPAKQYTSLAFTEALQDAWITARSAPLATPSTTPCANHGTFQDEAINDGGPTWKDRSAVEWQVTRWVHWYNATRLHSSIGYLPRLSSNSDTRQVTSTTTTPVVA